MRRRNVDRGRVPRILAAGTDDSRLQEKGTKGRSQGKGSWLGTENRARERGKGTWGKRTGAVNGGRGPGDGGRGIGAADGC